MGGFIILIMVASAIGYMWSGGEEFRYKDFRFKRSESSNLWYSEINGQQVSFYSLPPDAGHVNVTEGVISTISGTKMIYITFDPNQTDLTYLDLTRFDLSENLPKYFDIYAVSGMTANYTGYALPIVTCENATAFLPVVYLKRGNKTEVYFEGNCIIAEAATSSDFIRIRDRIMYGLFGIIN